MSDALVCHDLNPYYVDTDTVPDHLSHGDTLGECVPMQLVEVVTEPVVTESVVTEPVVTEPVAPVAMVTVPTEHPAVLASTGMDPAGVILATALILTGALALVARRLVRA